MQVKPDGSWASERTPSTNGYSATFTVKNTQTSTQTFCLTRESSANITTTGQDYTSVTLAPSESIFVNVYYNVGAAGPGYVKLWAECGGGIDSGTWNVAVGHTITLTPDGQTAAARITQTGGYTESFTLKNNGGALYTYTLTCSTSANVSCTGLTPRQVVLNAGAQATLVAAYDALGAGTGTLRVIATSGSVTDTGSYNVPVNNPTAGAPIVDASPMYGHRAQNMGRCAANCFAVTYAQNTVPYSSLDAPRSVTLAYHSDRVDPKPFVHVNVRPDSTYGQWPSEYRLQVRVNGAFVTFRNGEGQSGQPVRFAYPGNVWARLGGQFNASSYATGVYPMDILVTAYYAGSQSAITNTWSTKLIVVKEDSSAVARGWTLAGIQRLYQQGDGSVLITEGEGSAVYFPKTGAVLVTPAGEFSEVRAGVPTGGWTRAYADSTKVLFNSLGRMITVVDRFGNRDTVVYDGSNRVSKVKDPLNNAITLTYDGSGLTSIQDPMGRVTDIVVNTSKRLTTITDPDNVSTTFGYDGSQRLNSVTNRRGHATTFAYDTAWKLVAVTSPPVTYVKTDGNDTTGALVDSLRAWQRVGVPIGSTAATPDTAPTPDTVYGRLIDPGGHTMRFTVNRWGGPEQTTDPLGFVTTLTFDANGLPIRTVYHTGAKDTAAYNSLGLPVYVKAAGRDSATFFRYAAWAQADSIWTFGQPSARIFVGANGRVDSTRVGGGTADSAKTKFIYETRGRVERVTDAEGHLAARTWYAGTNGNRNRDSLPGGRVTTYSYDAYGRPSNVTVPGVNPQFSTYDVLNRVLRDSVAGFAPTVYAYDALYLESVTDPKGQVYGFTNNALGWTTALTDPAGRVDSVRHDREGLPRRWTNRRGQSVNYAYDIGHRPVAKSGVNTDSVSWTYSADGRIVSAKSPWAADTQFLSAVGRPDSLRTALAGQSFVQRFRYTSAGFLDSVAIAGGGIAFLGRTYTWNTQRGALKEIRLGAAVPTTLATNKDLQLTATTLPGGDLVSRGYSSVHDEAQISTSATYSGLATKYLSFDAAQRIARQIAADGMSGHGYFYDGLGRLVADSLLTSTTSCTGDPPRIGVGENGSFCAYEGTWVTVPSQSTSFGYDAVGNRTDRGGDYAVGNRIRQFDGCTYVTDSLGDGNVLSRTCGTETVRFYWNAESRLAAVKVVGGDSIDLRYDASGRLVRQDVNTLPRSYFLWQGDNLLAELNATATGKVAEYSYYPGLDNLHALITGTTPAYAHVDGRGNVIGLTNDAQSVQRSYEYDAWGILTGGFDYQPFANVDRARFKGALWLGEVGLYYMRARWYESKSGRFLSEDPLGLESGVNLYTYAANDPINGSDPTGTGCGWIFIGSATSIIGGVPTVTGVYQYVCLGSGGGQIGTSASLRRLYAISSGGPGGGGGLDQLRGGVPVERPTSWGAAVFLNSDRETWGKKLNSNAPSDRFWCLPTLRRT